MADIQVKKIAGHTEPFDEKKIVASLEAAGATHDVAQAVARQVKSGAHDGITTDEIYRQALDIIHAAEKRVAARYSVRRAVAELGPTGFPFEKFVAQIFYARGYQVLTDQIMIGACTEHEVDVVAYNDKELIVCEVKFHNELGMKSDLKVALYVKARHDDLREVTHMVAGKERTFTDGWLVTNTKFTKSAIGYALCEHLTLIGWNYPVKGNLEDLIAEHSLYPITYLTSLDTIHKHELIGKGIVLIKQIKESPQVLDELNLSKIDTQKVLDEITILF